jgi:hypothetical protein
VGSSLQTSTGKLMLLVVLIAFELVFFQDAWFIVMIPPCTATTLALNLGLWFVLLRPRWMETRIIGMLLGGVAAAAGSALYLWLGFREVLSVAGYRQVGPIGDLLITTATTWGQFLPQQGATPAMLLRGVANGALIIECALLDLFSMVILWAAGSLECRLRRRFQSHSGAVPAAPRAIDDRAATPL